MNSFIRFSRIPKLFRAVGIAAAGLLSAAPVQAQDFSNVMHAQLLTGWRQSDGSHMAAIQFDMAPGWHTYWRAPGDAGIPMLMDTQGSDNLKSSNIVWPRPTVFEQNGYRTIGYEGRVILPLRVDPKRRGQTIAFEARVDLGVCKEICIPKTLHIKATLPASGSARDPRISSALSDLPYSAKEAGVQNVRCNLAPSADGMTITAQFDLPKLRGHEAVVIETGNPLHWVSTPASGRAGDTMTATADIQHVEGAPLVIKRNQITISVIGSGEAIEIKGCARG